MRHPSANLCGGEIAQPARHFGKVGQRRPGVHSRLAATCDVVRMVVAQVEAEWSSRLAEKTAVTQIAFQAVGRVWCNSVVSIQVFT